MPRSRFGATTRGWYKATAQSDGVRISDLYIDSFQNNKVVALGKALKVNGKLEGVLGVNLLFANVEKKVASFKIRETGTAFLVDEAGRFIYHSMDLRPTDRTDEIGNLHNSFCTMAEGLKKLIATTVETAQQLAASSEELTASADQSARGAQHTTWRRPLRRSRGIRCSRTLWWMNPWRRWTASPTP